MPFSFLSPTPSHSFRDQLAAAARGVAGKMSSAVAATAVSGNSSRTIAHVVPATQTNPMIARMIGTVDMDGAGTEHVLPHVDPFILLDYGKITKNAMPPFGAHPHYGHSVVTVLLQGKVSSWDSFRPKTEQRHVITAPASYWVDAGSGVFHDEQSVIDNENDETQHVRLLQLWVGVQPADRKKAARVQYVDKLPTFDCCDAIHADKVIGKGVYHVGGDSSKIQTPHPIAVVHIQQAKQSTFRISVDPTHGGFVAHLKGKHTAYGGTVPTTCCDNDVLVLSKSNSTASSAESSYLEIQTGDDDDAEYIVCTGECQYDDGEEATWVKKLVANGAVIAATREEAQALVPQIEAMSAAGKADEEEGSFAPFGI
jgi:redox-sensitive bicupin YhaK (pirin superfamily)